MVGKGRGHGRERSRDHIKQVHRNMKTEKLSNTFCEDNDLGIKRTRTKFEKKTSITTCEKICF